MAEKFGPHVERLRAVAVSPSRRLLAIGGERDLGHGAGQAKGHNSGSQVHVLALPKAKAAFSAPVAGAVHALCFAGDELILAGAATGTLLGWDASAQLAEGAVPVEVLRSEAVHQGAIRGLAVHSSTKGDKAGSHTVASVGDDGVLRVLALTRAGAAAGATWKAEILATRMLSSRPLRAVVIEKQGPQGELVAAAGDDGVIRVLPLRGVADARIREMPCGAEGGIGALCFTGDGRIAAGCGDGSIRLCFVEGAVDAEDRAGEAAHKGAVRGLILGAELKDDAGRPLPQKLFSIAEDGELKGWVLDTRRRPRSLSLGSGRLTAMTLVPATSGTKAERRGGTLAVVDDQRQLTLITLDQQSEPSEEFERLGSQLVRLAEDLDASSVKVRQDAVEALAALAEDDARVLLDRALSSDRKPEVRKRAAEVLGASGRRLSRPALRQALNDADASVRKAALASLIEIDKDAPLAPVRAGLAAQHADIRVAAVQRLPGLRAVSPLVPGLIAERLKDQADEVRRAALDALWGPGAGAAGDPLAAARTALARGPADVRAAVLLRLWRERLADSAAAMVEAALDDEAAEVRRVAFLVLVAVRPALARKLAGLDERLRKALAELGQPAQPAAGEPAERDLAPLFSALTCQHADTALQAARSLGLLGDSRATGALLQLSRDPDATVRREVAGALMHAAMAMPADSRLTARLIWLLDDADAMVRAAAFDSLAELGAPSGAAAALELAGQALRSSREDIRLRALPILVEFGGRGKHASVRDLATAAGELLGRALDDEHERVRGEAFATLWAWHGNDPRTPLTLAAASRHADIRGRVVTELGRIKQRKPGHWADDLLLSLVRDSAASVGLAAYETLTGKRDGQKPEKPSQTSGDTDDEETAADRPAAEGRIEVHRAALDSSRPEVRAAGCKGAPRSAATELRARLVELVRDEHPLVHLAAIEAVDRLVPDDAEGFSAAFASVFYELRVRAAELCGKRRDRRAVAPMKELLTIPEGHLNRPSDGLRQRASRALADVGDPETIPFYVSLLDDRDPIVREMASRGLATAARPGDERRLVDALAHPDLPVRSWVAEGLARLGDDRAVPVLAGTLAHDHRPIRQGAIMGFAALGPDGVQGLLQGLDDRDRDMQDLVFAVIVARDVALGRENQAPDLLLSALSSASSEIRYGAARILEARMAGEGLAALAEELVGPRKPDKSSDTKGWPAEAERRKRLEILIDALASDHPAQRYAAAQVLSLRSQPLAFWREAGRLLGPTASARPRIPHTNWEDGEARQPRKRGWIRSLFGRVQERVVESATERVLTVLKFTGGKRGRAVPPRLAGFAQDDALRLVFGTYAGLIRQAPVRGESDETHRVRRDSIERLAGLATTAVGRDAVLPVLRRALGDPHHLVRKAAAGALRELYPAGALEPLGLALEASADVGRAAVDELVAAAVAGNRDAAALARSAIDAPVAEVRLHALTLLPRLYEAGSLEPWLIALGSHHADVRLAVVDRLMDALESPAAAALGEATRARVAEALGKALESDHEDLRLKAAMALARRGDARTVDVLAGMLRAEDPATARRAMEALVDLAHARPRDPGAAEVAAAAARTVAGRLDDDPDRTADRTALMDALGRIGSPAGSEVLVALLGPAGVDENAEIRNRAFTTLLAIARKRDDFGRVLPARPGRGDSSVRRVVYDEPLALGFLTEAAACTDARVRVQAARALGDIDDAGAEAILARLVEDREQEVRVAACESLAFRVAHVEGARIDTLASTLRAGRRELVLPAAAGLASRGRPEAFQALLLVLKAGEQAERERAVLALGMLGDRRALEELEPLVNADGKAELAEEDAALAPAAAEALGRMLPHLRDDAHGQASQQVPQHADQPGELTRVRQLVERLAREAELEIRKRALTGLRHAGDPRSRSLLEHMVAAVHEDTAVRVHAAMELGKLGPVAAESLAGSPTGSTVEMVLADALHDDARALRRAALEALERVFPASGPGGKLEHRTRTNLLALRSRHEDISAPAALFLARQGDPAVLVARLAEIDNREVRRRLRQGLVRRGACPVAEIAALLAGDDARPRADAAWIAGAAAGTGTLDAAARERLAQAVLRALERASAEWTEARTGAGVAASRELDTDAPGAVRLAQAEEAWEACLWAASRLGAPALAAARAVLRTGQVPAPVVREALHFVTQHGPGQEKGDDLALVRPMLSHADAAVRSAAASAIAALAPGRARAVIEDLAAADAAALAPLAQAAIQAGTDSARTLIETAASRPVVLPVLLGNKQAEALIAVAEASGKDRKGRKDPARLVAIASLGRLGGSAAEATLTKIFHDRAEEDAVRKAAFRALRRLQRQAARQARYGAPSEEGQNQ